MKCSSRMAYGEKGLPPTIPASQEQEYTVSFHASNFFSRFLPRELKFCNEVSVADRASLAVLMNLGTMPFDEYGEMFMLEGERQLLLRSRGECIIE